MNLKNFKKLEDKVKKPDFNKDFSGLNTILRTLSILGNVASIFLASFFVSGLLSVAIENEYVIWAITLIALCGLELTKREIFFRFSRDFIRTNEIFSKSVAPMLFFTMLLISLSFYSSLSGAMEFSSKSDNIEVMATKTIDTFADSTNAYYQEKINEFETRNSDLFTSNQNVDKQIQDLLDEHPTWTNSAKRLREGKELNNTQIEKNEDKIKEIKAERDNVVKDYKESVIDKSSKDINKNKSDSFIFIAISTLIEFLILIGIYFNNIFNFRSYKDTKKRLLNDDNFKTYYTYSEIIEILYLNRKEKDLIPSKELMVELLEMNKIYISLTQLEQSLKLFDALKIVETNEDKTYLLKEKEDAEAEMKKHFHI